MKKTGLFIFTAVSFMLNACGSSLSPQMPMENTSIAATVAAKKAAAMETEKENANETKHEEQKTAIAIAQQTLLDENDIKITVTGFDHNGSWGPEVKFLIENNSAQNITTQVRNCSVNGYMMDFDMSCNVAAGKKANDEMSISKNSLEEAGIKAIADINFSFHIFDSETWEPIKNTELISLQTNLAGTSPQTYDDSGQLLYDNSGIRIISKGLVVNNLSSGPELLMYMENNTDKGITIQAKDTAVNGSMIDPAMSVEIVPGKRILASMLFYDSELKENNIVKISEIETSFHIFYTDDWDTVENTEPIVISFK